MSIFIDSANIKQIQAAIDLGWVTGITTNPLLLAKSDQSPGDTLSTIKKLFPGPIFYQLVSQYFESMMEEASFAQGILENQLVIKLPPNDLGFKICSQLSSRIMCCPTAIYSPAQALIARESGAQFIALYVNRATRLMGNGIQLIREVSTVLQNCNTKIVAASIKSPQVAVAAVQAGAHHLTLPYETLIQMPKNDLSQAAIMEFQKDGTGLIN